MDSILFCEFIIIFDYRGAEMIYQGEGDTEGTNIYKNEIFFKKVSDRPNGRNLRRGRGMSTPLFWLIFLFPQYHVKFLRLVTGYLFAKQLIVFIACMALLFRLAYFV